MKMSASVGHRAKGECVQFVTEHRAFSEQTANAPKERAPVEPPVSGHASG